MQYNIGKIKVERIKRGWSQTELAKHIDAHSSTISLIESGKINGSPGMIKRIANVFGLSMEDFIIETDSAA